MHYQQIDKDKFIIRINRGEKIIASLKRFCRQLRIVNGFFYGLGALDEIIIAIYNLKTKTYHEKKYKKDLEITNITGNVADSKEGIIIHSHIALSDTHLETFGGHLIEGKVSGTLELFFTKLDTRITREFDQKTGLKLMKLDQRL